MKAEDKISKIYVRVNKNKDLIKELCTVALRRRYEYAGWFDAYRTEKIEALIEQHELYKAYILTFDDKLKQIYDLRLMPPLKKYEAEMSPEAAAEWIKKRNPRQKKPLP